jgi:type 1 glutamine amidotransferase
MLQRLTLILCTLALAGCMSADDSAAPVGEVAPVTTPGPAPLVYEAGPGPGAGRHIVFIAGDDEYRSEEALPQLAAILAVRHGFRCTVLFSTSPVDGTIDPTARDHIPGLDALDDADLLVIFTRFRQLPDADMKHIVDFVNSKRPVIGLRTATHAFAYDAGSQSPYARWSWDSKDPASPGGFGQQVLGTTWVAHHGKHGEESTHGVIQDAVKDHAILRGVDKLWTPTDVYAVGELPPDAYVLVEGEVLGGMKADAVAVADGRNSPRMPVAWTREIPLPGSGAQRVFCTTMGAAIDLKNEGLRRMLVNACYWCLFLGPEIPDRANVDVVGSYEPTMFGFDKFKRGVHPQDLALPAGKS